MSELHYPFQAQTLVELLQQRAHKQPEQIAYRFLVDGETAETSLTYRVLAQQARAIAANLQSVCGPGERALLLYQPGLEYITAFMGCLYGGVIAVPAYPPRPNRSMDRLSAIITDAQATVALTTQSVLVHLQRRLEQTPELSTVQWFTTDVIAPHHGDNWRPPSLTRSTLAFLQYTSGSTAAPKGVKIAHEQLLHNLARIYQLYEHSPKSCALSWLPMYHDMGLIGGVLQPLYGGFLGVLLSPLMFLQNPLRWLKAIMRYRATSSGAPSFAYHLVCRKVTPNDLSGLDLSTWDVAFNGAEPISYEILSQFADVFAPCGFRKEAFYPCYGMAEATLIISGGKKLAPVVTQVLDSNALEHNQIVPAHADKDRARILVGCGHSLPDQKIVIVDPQTRTSCQAQTVGEIWVMGPSIAQGYWQLPDVSDDTFGAYLADTGEGPFLRTGDLGFVLDEEVFITGRLKDVIIINGRNHYPQDIEWTVEQAHPAIRPSCVAGISVYLAGAERLVILAEVERRFRERQPGSTQDHPLQNGTSETMKLIRLIRRAVSQEHDLQVHETILLKPGSIPKTSSGKIQRHACRAHFLAGTLDSV